MMTTLGQKIRELREQKDLSLRELAKEIGVTAAFLSDVELGRRYPSDEVFEDLARTLKIPASELRTYDTRPPVEDIKRMTEREPAFGLAFRKVVDSGVTPEDLIKLAEKKAARK